MRVVPTHDLAGCAFRGPGVDLVGDEMEPALELAKPMFAYLDELEPGVMLRSIAIDCERLRVLATIPGNRARVVRLDGHAAEETLRHAAPLVDWLADRAMEKIARRTPR